MTTRPQSDLLLRRALQANAAFCGLSGVLLAAAAVWFGDLTGLDSQILRLLGIGLVLYAAVLFRWSSRPELRTAEAWFAIAGDVAWVVGTLILVLVFSDEFTTAGVVLTAVVATIVADFAVVQWIGVRRMSASD